MNRNQEEAVYGFMSLGLIGGSIARAIRKKYPKSTIIAYNRSKDPLHQATSDGVVNREVSDNGEEFKDCDVVFLCAPVEVNRRFLDKLKGHVGPDTILTDVGSVKGDIHRYVREIGVQKQFIGGHPMTGSERVGYRNSKASFMENAYYILAPEPEFPKEKTKWMEKLVQALGSIPLVLSCNEHDYVTAGVSHVPHVISALLVHLVQDCDNKEEIMKMIAAGGFKDITRISSSSPEMWEQICLTNPDNILKLLDRYADNLGKIRETIANHDADGLYKFFDGARRYRDSFIDQSSGPIKTAYVLHADVEDRPGVIAAIVQLLAREDINIKNIGISHNREYEAGVLRIEFHDEPSLDKSRRLLTLNGYMLH